MNEIRILTIVSIILLVLFLISGVFILQEYEQQRIKESQKEYRILNVFNTTNIDCSTIRNGQTYNDTHCIYEHVPKNLSVFVSQ